jgi:hypothetical protein
LTFNRVQQIHLTLVSTLAVFLPVDGKLYVERQTFTKIKTLDTSDGMLQFAHTVGGSLHVETNAKYFAKLAPGVHCRHSSPLRSTAETMEQLETMMEKSNAAVARQRSCALVSVEMQSILTIEQERSGRESKIGRKGLVHADEVRASTV